MAVKVPRQKEFERRLQHTEKLVQELDSLPDESSRAVAIEAVEAILELHGEAFDRVLGIASEQGEPGHRLIDALARDPMVGGLLLLHGLHPQSLEERVLEALVKVKPYLASHGGSVELLEVSEEGVVRLRLEGSCHGCASSAVTLKYAIEKGIMETAPDVERIEVEGAVEEPKPPAGFVPLGAIRRPPAAHPLDGEEGGSGDWMTISGLNAAAGNRVEVREVSGRPVLFCAAGGNWLAYRDGCPACGMSFDGVELQDVLLRCAGCGAGYDVRSAGRSTDRAGLHLQPLPLLSESGKVRIAAGAAGS